MTETTKTAIFLALALAFVGLAVLSRPAIREIKMEEMVGKPLFPKFDDPLAVKKLEIVRSNTAGDVEEFRIADVDGVWSIPSHDNYPADAKEQMGRVSEALVDLKVLDVVAKPNEVSDATKIHAMYGVIDPTSENASLGEGIGVKVKLAGVNDEPLVDLIVGKEVATKENTDPGDSEESGKMRYVRVSGQVPVYVVQIDPQRFSTNFDQWIEKNLLDISTYNIKEIFVDEYSLKTETQLTQRGLREVLSPTFTGYFLLGYDSNATGAEKWKLGKWMGFRDSNREYYERKLPENEELNTEVLDEMISALNDLKIVNVTKKPSVFAAALRSGSDLESLEPDPSLQKSGFYLVPIPDFKVDSKKTKKQLLSNEGDIQLRMKDGIRYTLRFGDLTGTESEIVDPTASPFSPEDPKTTKMGANRYLFITADFDESAIAQPETKEIPEVPTEGDEDVVNKAKAEKESVEKANQREQDRYDEEVKAGKERAKKLMERFADWYYVIPEDVYKKIHLTGNNVFRAKKSDAPGGGPQHGEDGHVCDGDCDHVTDATKTRTDNLPTLPGMGNLPGTMLNQPADKVPGSEDKNEEASMEAVPAENNVETPAEMKKLENDSKETSIKEESKPENDSKEEPDSKSEAENAPKMENKPSEDRVQEKKDDESSKEPFDPFGGANPST